MKKYMVTQNNTSSFFEDIDEAIASMTFEDAELWEEVLENSYIKIYLS